MRVAVKRESSVSYALSCMSSQRPPLSFRRLIAWLLYAVTALAAVAIGAIYLFRTSFMPYHSAALGKSWARFTTPIALLLFYVPALLATLSVDQNTPASSPWQPLAIACGLVTVGFLMDTPWLGERGMARHDTRT